MNFQKRQSKIIHLIRRLLIYTKYDFREILHIPHYLPNIDNTKSSYIKNKINKQKYVDQAYNKYRKSYTQRKILYLYWSI